MGKIVGAAVVCHQPIIMAPDEVRTAMGKGRDTTMVAGFAQMRDALDAVEADTLVIFDTHWSTTAEHVVAGAERFEGVYTSDELPGVIADHGYSYAGVPKLAAAIAEAAGPAGVPVMNCVNPHISRHYPTLNLVHHLKRDGVLPAGVLSVGTCQTAEAHNFLEFGKLLGEAVGRTDCRAVLLASGGLSHTFWPLDVLGEHLAFDIKNVRTAAARQMDEKILECWGRGDHAAVIDLHDDYLPHNPEGRFGHYLMMAGALGGRDCRARGRKMSEYENAAGTGQVHMWFDL